MRARAGGSNLPLLSANELTRLFLSDGSGCTLYGTVPLPHQFSASYNLSRRLHLQRLMQQLRGFIDERLVLHLQQLWIVFNFPGCIL